MINFNEIPFNDTELRDYQVESKKKIYNAWQKHRSVMFQMPTGTGKTRLFVSIVKDLHNWGITNKKAVKTLILAHRQELIEQISENVGYHYGLAHGVIMSRFWQQENLPTQIASVQTLKRRLNKWKEKGFDLIIVDEAHHALAETYVTILKTFPNAKVLGVTATPYRMNRASFKPLFDELITSKSVGEFINTCWLSNYEYFSVKPDSNIQKLIDNIDEFAFDGDYAESALTRIFDNVKIRAKIVDTYLKYAKGKRGIVYTIDITHNNHVRDEFIKAGIKAVAIDSHTPKERRKELVSDFRKGKIDILCNVNIFSEGFDCPDVEFIQLARPTQSLSMYLQQVGRGFRITEGKEKVIFLDNVGLYNRFGLPSIRRQWRKYFEGIQFDETKEIFNQNNSLETKTIVRYIEEGDEEIDLVYTTATEKTGELQFDEITDFPVISPNSQELGNLFMNLGGVDFEDEELESIVAIIDQDPDNELLSTWDWIVERSFKKIRKKDKWGIWDSKQKKVVVPIIYDEICIHDKLKRSNVRSNDKWGILDCNTCKVTIPAEYDSIEKIYLSNFFVVEKNQKFGVIDQLNTMLIPIKYDEVLGFKNKSGIHFNVRENEKWKLYYENFRYTYTLKNRGQQLLNNFYQAEYKGVYAIVDNNNQIKIPCIISKIKKTGIPELPLFVQIGSYTWAALDNELDWAILPEYSHISEFQPGILKVKNLMGYGLVKYDGTFLIPCQYNDIAPFFDVYIVYIAQEKIWRVIDLAGNPIGIEAHHKLDCRIMMVEKLKKENPGIELAPLKKKGNIPTKGKQKGINGKEGNDKPKRIKKPVIELKSTKQKEKAVLLLSIMELISSEKITSSRIYQTNELARQFENNFIKYGLKSVRMEFEFGAAFYWLKDEEFWNLIPNKGESIDISATDGNPFTLSRMKKKFCCAEISLEFYQKLIDTRESRLIEHCLIRMLY